MASFTTLYAVKPTGNEIDEDWHNWGYATYISFKDHDISAFTNKVKKIWHEQEKRLGNNIFEKISLVPLAEVHFHRNSKRQFIFLLQLIGVFILVIAIINFINLTIAKSTTRAREIGIRKVLGSSALRIVNLLSGGFTRIVLASMLISLPVSYLITKHWLDSFAYRIDLQVWYFIGAGLITLFIAWITVGTQALRAATANPVESLRYE